MDRRYPSRNECLTLAAFATIWILVWMRMAPDYGGADVYLFRDAACNLAHGGGFRTASFEHSRSFNPLLYSSYTPGTLWLFALPAWLFGCGAGVAGAYACFWAILAEAIALVAGIRFAPRGPLRWTLLTLAALLLPFGPVNLATERPETIAFVTLAVVLFLQRRLPTAGRAMLTGALSAGAFLIEPFAGVLAALLTAAWLLVPVSDGSRTSELPYGRMPYFRKSLLSAILALVFFALPIAIVAICFYREDHASLHRFLQQATAAGINRSANYRPGDLPSQPLAVPAQTHGPSPNKYWQAAMFHKSIGPVHVAEVCGGLVVGLIWFALLLRATGPRGARIALLILGFACFVIPLAVFPLQGNYLSLTRALFPIALAVNWLHVRSSLRSTAWIPLLIILGFVSLLPAVGIRVLTGLESRRSYEGAREQANLFAGYIKQHPLHGSVVLVPSTHFYLYKGVAADIYNPSYLSPDEQPESVGAVVNCYTGSRDFGLGTLSLPSFVAGRHWRLLSPARDSLHITLLQHPIMSRNWGMGCDVYVPAD